MATLSRRRQAQSLDPTPHAGVILGGRSRSIMAYKEGLQEYLESLASNVPADLLKSATRHNQLAEAILCGRILKSDTQDRYTFEMSRYCRQTAWCKKCEWNRAHNFASRRESKRSLIGNHCFSAVIHFENAESHEAAVTVTELAHQCMSKLAKRCQEAASTLDVELIDYVVGLHFKRPPGSTILQPHLHLVLVLGNDARVSTTENHLLSWFDRQRQVMPRLNAMKIQHRGKIKPSSGSTTNKTCSVVEANNQFAYAIRLSEPDELPGDSIARADLLAKAGVTRTFTSKRIGAGQAAGPSEYVSNSPYLFISLLGHTRWLRPRYRKQAINYLKTEAIRYIEAAAEGRDYRPSNLDEKFFFPVDMPYESALQECSAN
jgi:hypothetical protein